MAERREYQGAIFERSGPGQQWVNVGAAPVNQSGGVLIQNPYEAKEQARKEEDQGLDRARLGISQQAEARQAATLPYDVRQAAADATKAEAAANAALKEQAAAPRPETAKLQRTLQTDTVLELINAARGQIGKGWATGNVAGTGAFQALPFVGQNSTNLAATLSGIQGNVINDTLTQLKAASANGASGYGSLTETEAQRLAAAVGALQQSQDEDALRTNLGRVEKHYRNALALLNNEDPRIPEIAAKYGIPQDDRPSIPGAGPSQLTSEGRYETDPSLSGVNQRVSQMIQNGANEADVRGYLNQVQPGLGDKPVNIAEAITFARQNPNIPPSIDIERSWVPASGVSGALGEIGMTPFGAGVIGAADTITLGALDNLTANPELARATMAGVSEQNPTSYLLGQIGGGVGTGLGLEAGLGRLGLTGLSRARAGDVGFGALYGAGTADETDDSRIAGALLGGASGLAGGALGRGAARAGGRAIAGVRDAAQVGLDRAGVPMTIGQILGGRAKSVEDRLAGLPFVGDAINGARREGMEGFNRAAMGEAVAPIGAPAPGAIGEAGVQANQDAISNAYRSALEGQNFTADPQFTSDVAAALAQGGAIPQLGDQFTSMAQNRVGSLFDQSGNISGNGFQDAIQGLRKARSATANEVMGPEFSNATGSVEDALYGLVQRQSPGVTEAYDAANAAYRNQSVVDDAVLRALNQGGTFTPAQLGMSARQNARQFGGKRSAARGDRPFAELQRAGQEVLPSQIPDSGTAGRLALPAAVGALAGGGSYATQDGQPVERASGALGAGAIAALLAAAPYSAPARATIQRALVAERPQAVQQVGDLLIDNNRIAGLLAAPLTVEQILGGY